MKFLFAFMSSLLVLPIGALGTLADTSGTPQNVGPNSDTDVIARVGDQNITFSEINVALNSSGIVGVSIPALGTPERDTARIVLLDRFISANLLYLDALSQGVDQDPRYRRAVSRFSDAIMAGLYRQRILAGDIAVTEEEVQSYISRHLKPGTEITADLRLQIESQLRRQKLHAQLAAAEKTLRDDVRVVIHEDNLAGADDAGRAADTPLAEVGAESITWGQVGDKIIAAGKGATMADPLAFEQQARRDALEREIDLRIMVQKARAAGLQDDALYNKRLAEYRKTLLTNMHRENLVKGMEPSDEQLKAYYDANRSRFVVPEARKVQTVVVKTEEQAKDLKRRIEAGEMTMYQAASEHSIAPHAAENLGEVGWVNRAQAAAALDQQIFSLGPGEISDPVESPTGWQLVAVQEIREEKYTDIGDEATRRLTRRQYLHDKVDAYTAELRNKRFAVEVYQDRLVQLAQQEADAIGALARKATEPGSVTMKRIEEMQKYIKPSSADNPN